MHDIILRATGWSHHILKSHSHEIETDSYEEKEACCKRATQIKHKPEPFHGVIWGWRIIYCVFLICKGRAPVNAKLRLCWRSIQVCWNVLYLNFGMLTYAIFRRQHGDKWSVKSVCVCTWLLTRWRRNTTCWCYITSLGWMLFVDICS